LEALFSASSVPQPPPPAYSSSSKLNF
jgi:hypothetical protein